MNAFENESVYILKDYCFAPIFHMNRKLIPYFILSFFCLLAAGVSAQEKGEWKKAAVVDASDPEASTRWGKAEVYEYSAEAAAPWTGNRKIFFGKPLGVDFEGVSGEEDCRVTAVFLSDGDRTLSVDFNGADFDDQLAREKARVVLTKGVPVTRAWDVPKEKIKDGKLNVTINTVSGANAVLQKMELETRDGKPVSAVIRKKFEDVTDADLEKLVMPLPRLTPRPSSVKGVKKPILSLNGEWEFSPEDNGKFSPIKVPGEWAMQGFKVPEKGFALYRKELDIPADWKGRQIKLRFDAVHAVCRVSLNGVSAGSHSGGFVPFELDVTKSVRSGGRNVLEVWVQCESPADYFACMSQYAVHQVGGILRKVTLFAVPEVHIASENNTTSLDESYRNAVLHYETEVRNASAEERKIRLLVELKDREGKVAASCARDIVLPGGGLETVSCDLSVDKANLWTSETPYLYTLACSLESNGEELSSHSLKTGLRKVELQGNLLLVNGKPVKLLGIDRHEIHPLTGRSITPELCREDAELFKGANVNLIRTSHYPPSEEFLDVCDELGLFVESEAALCWVGMYGVIWRQWNHLNPEYFPHYLIANLDHLAAYRNHPSILFWSMANESAWTPLWKKVMQVMKRYEKSRPIIFHDNYTPGRSQPGDESEIANYHYPAVSGSSAWSKEKRPVWFGEYAHLQCYNRHELATDPFIQEDWSRPLQHMVDLMWEQPGCLGGAIWSGIDDVFHLPDGNLCGYGHWGPIDGWRRRKPEYHGLKMAYSPIRFFAVEAESGKPVKWTLQNRQNFLNMKENVIEWTAGDRSGRVMVDLSPHARGEMVISENFKGGETLCVSVKDPSGREIAREAVTIAGGEAQKEKTADKPEKYHLAWDFNRKALVSSQGAQIGIPVPMVLPLNSMGGANGPSGRTLANVIDPFTSVEGWVWSPAESVDSSIRFHGKGAVGEGELELVPQEQGRMLVRYKIKVAKDVNPRQWGMVFSLPQDFDTIQWNRKAYWSWYPEEQMGRSLGMAKANPSVRKFVEEPGKKPENIWKENSNALGTNDFRSTKANIVKASLVGAEKTAFTITPAEGSKGAQSVRAWVDGDKIRVLAAGFNTGGADHFFATHYSEERKPLKKGETIESEFVIELDSVNPVEKAH